MLAFSAAIRIYVTLESVDMRKQYDGLGDRIAGAGRVSQKRCSVLLTSRERTRLKLLHWDDTDVWVLAKRLEQGCFSAPEPGEATRKLAPETIALLIEARRRAGAEARYRQSPSDICR